MLRAVAVVLAIVPVLVFANPELSLKRQEEPKKKKRGFGIGLDVSAFFPSDKDIVRAFSATSVGVGLSPTNIYYKEGTRFIWDVGINGDSQAGSRYFTIAPTVGYIYSVKTDESNSSFRPYVAVRVGPAYADYSILKNNVRFKDRKFGWNANAEIGLFLTDKFRISARYDKFSEHDGFDLGGLRVGATWQFLRF